jgi:flagellum-specific ATP synthase
LEADVVVIALIGERGREVRQFLEDVLGTEGRKRSIVIVSTSDQSPLVKKRGGQLALTAAEHFRDEGCNVLLIFDSITRYADAHREVALAAGEPPSLHAYPPSTFREIAALAERAGPGVGTAGDITAVFSVLVAGSDMEEPVADIVRGVLDGHVVLSRSIAERGRFPAIDVRRSVSRSLPSAATAEENAMLLKARAILGAYEDVETMIRAGLYVAGADPRVDEAIRLWPALDLFVSKRTASPEAAFEELNAILQS